MVHDRAMFTGPLEDRIAIRELHETYGLGVLNADPGSWGATWAPDARWDLMGHVVEGREAIVGFWTTAMAQFAAVSFVSIPAAIEVAGDRATGITQTHEVLRQADGATRVVGGAYEDRFVRLGGGWRYAERRFRIVAQHPEGS
jgi:ketosteroid isomerase-like protein